MDLKVSSTGFGGKKEVMYALKNAAREAKRAELFKAESFGPRPINRESQVLASKEKLQAYMDMAVYDDAFEKTIDSLPKEEAGKELKNTLKTQKLQWGEINPNSLFSNSLVVNCIEQEKTINIDILNAFLKFLR